MRWLVGVACLLLGGLAGAGGHVPVPDRVLDPQSAPEAWNVLRLATANVERLLKDDRLAEINDQLSLCGPALRALPRFAAPERSTVVAEQAVRGSVAVSSMAQAIVAGDRVSTETAFTSLRAALDKAAAAFDPGTVHADIFYCPMHPDVLGPDAAAICPNCGMALVPRRIPYSFIYVPPGKPSLVLTAATDHSVTAGKPVQVVMHLRKRDGSPVVPSDLTITHTQPIHLLVVDPALEDYQHEHPTPTTTPGEYTFAFTPRTNRSYRIFADVVPVASGVQEFPFVDLPGEGFSPIAHRSNTYRAEASGFVFHLSVEDADREPLRARQARSLRITVETPDGRPVKRLQPVMAAFAHLVGFYDDRRTLVHLHPAGGEITNPAARGGPSLDCKLYPPKAGFLRLYVQVRVDDQDVFAPFDLNVEP